MDGYNKFLPETQKTSHECQKRWETIYNVLVNKIILILKCLQLQENHQ